jgi:hypothetical protein
VAETKGTRVKQLSNVLLAAALLVPASAAAQERPVEHKLSEAEKERLLDEAVERRELLEEALPAPKRRVHGEVGVAIGTGGFRSIYGSSVVPIGEEGSAAIAFEHSEWDDRRGKRRHRR